MVLTIKNKDGYVVAYSESNKVNSDGKKDKSGDFIRVENFWIHEKLSRLGILKQLVQKMNNHPFYKKCTYIYWLELRTKNGDKIIDENYSAPDFKVQRIYNKNVLANKIIGDSICLENCLV